LLRFADVDTTAYTGERDAPSNKAVGQATGHWSGIAKVIRDRWKHYNYTYCQKSNGERACRRANHINVLI
jgi:hypothetical protein